MTKILDLLHESYLVMEREISLLKQVEKLQKNHEDSKFAEVSSTIQSKLTQKNQKIEIWLRPDYQAMQHLKRNYIIKFIYDVISHEIKWICIDEPDT